MSIVRNHNNAPRAERGLSSCPELLRRLRSFTGSIESRVDEPAQGHEISSARSRNKSETAQTQLECSSGRLVGSSLTRQAQTPYNARAFSRATCSTSCVVQSGPSGSLPSFKIWNGNYRQLCSHTQRSRRVTTFATNSAVQGNIPECENGTLDPPFIPSALGGGSTDGTMYGASVSRTMRRGLRMKSDGADGGGVLAARLRTT